jgi:hypothetical protein
MSRLITCCLLAIRPMYPLSIFQSLLTTNVLGNPRRPPKPETTSSFPTKTG